MYEDLVKQLEGASGPNRDLDADIFIALEQPTWVKAKNDLGAVAANEKHFWPMGKLRFITRDSRFAPSYTASLDSATELLAKVLPKWWGSVDIGDWRDNPYSARLRLGENSAKVIGQGKTPALAIVVAIFRALQTEEPALNPSLTQLSPAQKPTKEQSGG